MDWANFHNIVGDEPRGAKIGRHGTSPLSQKALWEVPVATEKDVEDCVAAARQAFPAWARQPYEQRTQLLDRFADLYLSHAAEFSRLLADECGRTVSLVATPVPAAKTMPTSCLYRSRTRPSRSTGLHTGFGIHVR